MSNYVYQAYDIASNIINNIKDYILSSEVMLSCYQIMTKYLKCIHVKTIKNDIISKRNRNLIDNISKFINWFKSCLI